MSLTTTFLDELRARTTLSTLIGRTVKVTKAGREFKACCPFHNEKSPSFTINDEKGFYHCFGCGAHGDAIRWMTDQRGLPFMDAVKELAANAGLDVPAADPRAAERAERANSLYDVMTAAADWFTEQLGSIAGAEARAYLEQRGLNTATIKAFGIGFAPDSRGKLRTALAKFGDAALIEAGLLISVDEKEPYDRFRGRLMIPIRDPRGRVIAFGGRILGAGEPKYLNSPDTPLFDKGRTLYNLDRAAAAARKSGRVIVVEGYMDVIALAQAQFEDVAAPLGTAVTDDQIHRLWRFSDSPIICFDGDNPGQKAAQRAGRRALAISTPGKSMAFADMPKGEDPDDVLRNSGVDALNDIINSATSLHRFLYYSEKFSIDAESPDGRAQLRQNLENLSDSCENKINADEYRRTFRSYFFEDFGWKKRDRRALGSSILKTSPISKSPMVKLYIRSALYGLSRFPRILVENCEAVGFIKIDHPDLLRWRESLVEVALSRPGLEYDGVRAILETVVMTNRQQDAMRFDLRFPFDRLEADDGFVSSRLAGLVSFLTQEQNLIDEMQKLNVEANEAFQNVSLADYNAVELARQEVRERTIALHEWGYELGQPQEMMQ
jgi:DNA primase